MDKKSIIGFVLISVILIAWLIWNTNTQKKSAQEEAIKKQATEQIKDTVSKKDSVIKKEEVKQSVPDSTFKDKAIFDAFGSTFSKASVDFAKDNPEAEKEKIITIENSKFLAEFTNYGAALRRFVMKDYKMWDGAEMQLIDWKAGKELSLFFTSKDGKPIDTRNLVFKSNYNGWDQTDIQKNPDYKLRFELALPDDSTSKIIFTYSFRPDAYDFNVEYELYKPDSFISGSKYEVVWSNSLNLTEFRSDEEATFSEAFAYMGGELKTLTASKVGEEVIENLNGNTEYVSSRNKYFGVFLVPEGKKGEGAYLKGNRYPLPNDGVKCDYLISVKNEIKKDNYEKSNFKVIIAPLDYSIIKSYGIDLQLTMRFALDFIVRPIAQFAIIPFFSFLHSFIPNYGLVIIIFSIVLKIILNPLTSKQMDSMKKMGQLQPKMTAIKEKYKDDPTKQNSMIMKLYKEEGINPMGGCLPMLLQLPILYALFGVFRSTIELRQADFIWWIKDLSAPDILFNLPFKIPVFGIDSISGVATLMGITMFIQQKMTVTDPKQKAMVYMMPVLFTLLFFNFPSGLNLYYFVFNLLSIGQQIYTNKFKKVKPDDLIKIQNKPKKKSFFERLQDMAEEQRKSRNKRR